VTDRALESYFADARGWDIDRAAQGIKRERIAWITSIVATALALILGCALGLLMPLKRVEPFVIRVDNSTGIVDIVPMYPGSADIGETAARYLLTHYVTTCEGFSYATAKRDYEECGAYHSAQRNAQWYTQWVQTNPNSPLNLNKDGSVVRVQVTAVTFFNKDARDRITNIAQVRYIKARRPPGGSERITHWIATLEYVWGTPSRVPEERQLNPIGWRITDFRTEPESLPDESSTAPTT
jgi:type IV secretion system protein VirB8